MLMPFDSDGDDDDSNFTCSNSCSEEETEVSDEDNDAQKLSSSSSIPTTKVEHATSSSWKLVVGAVASVGVVFMALWLNSNF